MAENGRSYPLFAGEDAQRWAAEKPQSYHQDSRRGT